MLIDDIAEFNKLCPGNSVLGREFRLLTENLDKHQLAFSAAPDKMNYDTRDYRRANNAVMRFLSDILPRVRRFSLQVDADSRERLDIFEGKVQHAGFEKHRISVDRRLEARIWQHYALDCYRKKLPHKIRIIQRYHPTLVSSLLKSWKTFRNEVKVWKYSRIQWDGSRAMHAMFFFLLKVNDLAASCD